MAETSTNFKVLQEPVDLHPIMKCTYGEFLISQGRFISVHCPNLIGPILLSCAKGSDLTMNAKAQEELEKNIRKGNVLVGGDCGPCPFMKGMNGSTQWAGGFLYVLGNGKKQLD